ncbi:hypothetical protein U91I_02636 [alpha proteobacterium U9-1i]|nr:hypothetical protein U91I_02636 [alpha proteobacterium U9-1i]
MREGSRAARNHGASGEEGDSGRSILTALFAVRRAHVAERDTQANGDLIDGFRLMERRHCDRMRRAAMLLRLRGRHWRARLFVGRTGGIAEVCNVIRYDAAAMAGIGRERLLDHDESDERNAKRRDPAPPIGPSHCFQVLIPKHVATDSRRACLYTDHDPLRNSKDMMTSTRLVRLG